MFHNFHQQQMEIPEWFLQMRKDVWESLSDFIGMEQTPANFSKVEKAVNDLIDSWEHPVTFQGQVVKSVMISPEGKVNIIC